MTLMMVGLIMEIRRHIYLFFVFDMYRKKEKGKLGRRTSSYQKYK